MAYPGTDVRASAAAAPATASAPWGFAEIFVISQTALPALLYLPGTQAIRFPIRVSAFAISLLAFGWWLLQPRVRTAPARAQAWLTAVLALVGLMIFHPGTASLVGGIAHVAVYAAVIVPVFWAPDCVRTPGQFARVMWILLLCCGVNALVGVLQVYDPNRFLPQEFSHLYGDWSLGLGPVTFIGPNGQQMVRPPGLFDTPGAVAGPGMTAALLGLIFAVSASPLWQRVTAAALGCAGLAAIYLSQVRISLVLAVAMFTLYVVVLFRQRRVARGTQFATAAAAVVFGSFVLALTLGGESIQNRVETLLADDPVSVYQQARGSQLSLAVNDLLYEYPAGAGLARWGMMAGYFGRNDPNRPPLWAEIQLTGWLIDGGPLLVVLYLGALGVTTLYQWRLTALTSRPRLAQCAAVAFCLEAGAAGLVLSFTPFVTQVGIQYWFLAGALHGVAFWSGVRE